MNYDKRTTFSRAKELLGRADEASLHYCCLELRFCLEAIAYEKLATYAKRLPKEVLDRWQPPQVLKALLEFEPLADQDFVLRLCEEDEDGAPKGEWHTLGAHRAPKLRWIRKTYNKMGSYLHLPAGTARGTINSDALREDLGRMVVELEPIVASSLDASLATVVEFTCDQCGNPILCNEEGVRRSHRAVCLNPNCNAEYYVEEKDGSLLPQLKVSEFQCLACGDPVQIENRHIRPGFEFSCISCGAHHQVVSRHWKYGFIENSPNTAANQAAQPGDYAVG